MKINEMIRERRLSKKYTQEQLAKYLGVTASAVNKWEKAISYPDITILPALARLLDTDLNTLLCFKGELTEKEVAVFMNHLSEVREKRGFQETYETAFNKIKEYPTSYALILNTAMFLEGALLLDTGIKNSKENYQTAIEELYRRVLDSKDETLCNQARGMLISKYMAREEYDKAEEMIQLLPDESFIDKKQLRVNLFINQGRLEEAAKLEEEKLLFAANEVQTVLITLMEIAVKERRWEDAEYMADVSRDIAKLLDLWEYNTYTAHFQLYSVQKNYVKCIKVFLAMMKSLAKKWKVNQSPLYRHIKMKETDDFFGAGMQKKLVQAVCADKEMSYLKDSREVQELIKEMDR